MNIVFPFIFIHLIRIHATYYCYLIFISLCFQLSPKKKSSQIRIAFWKHSYQLIPCTVVHHNGQQQTTPPNDPAYCRWFIKRKTAFLSFPTPSTCTLISSPANGDASEDNNDYTTTQSNWVSQTLSKVRKLLIDCKADVSLDELF